MEKGDFIHFVSLFDIDSACETMRKGASGWSGYMLKRKQQIYFTHTKGNERSMMHTVHIYSWTKKYHIV